MNMVEKFKENKKILQIKMDQAAKMVNDAAEEFVDTIESLVKDASEEDVKAFMNVKDEMIDLEDKMAVIAAFAENHDGIAGIAIIGHRK